MSYVLFIAHQCRKKKWSPFIKSFQVEVLHLILCEEKAQSQAKTRAFLSVWVITSPINSSELLGVKKKKWSPCAQLYLEVSYMFLCAKLTKLQRKENFDTIRIQIQNGFWYVICVVIPNEAPVMLLLQGITLFIWVIIKKLWGFPIMLKQRGNF